MTLTCGNVNDAICICMDHQSFDSETALEEDVEAFVEFVNEELRLI